MPRSETTTQVTGSNHPPVVDYAHADQYTLSIRVSADGFCFAVHHPEQAEKFAFLPYDIDPLVPVVANLRQAREEIPMLQQAYGKVQFLLTDAPCQVIPAEYAVEQLSACSLRFPDRPEVVSFSVEDAVVKWTEEVFPKAQFYPGLYPVLRFAFQHEGCLCHLHGRRMDMVSVAYGRLNLVNTFEIGTASDALYYLLGTWQALGLSQQDDLLTIVGRSACKRELKAKASRFIRRVEEPLPAQVFHTTELARLSAVPFDLQCLTAYLQP